MPNKKCTPDHTQGAYINTLWIEYVSYAGLNQFRFEGSVCSCIQSQPATLVPLHFTKL